MKALSVFLVLFLAGCNAQLPTPQERYLHARHVAAQAGFSDVVIQGKDFQHQGFIKQLNNMPRLRVYFEDAAEPHPRGIAATPSPVSPQALQLAIHDEHPNVAYFSLVCQYTHQSGDRCQPAYWDYAQLSGPVLQSFNAALDKLKAQTQATELELNGLGVGAQLAMILASQREDVHFIRTLALPAAPPAYADAAGTMRSSHSHKRYGWLVREIPQVHVTPPEQTALSFLKQHNIPDMPCAVMIPAPQSGASLAPFWQSVLQQKTPCWYK